MSKRKKLWSNPKINPKYNLKGSKKELQLEILENKKYYTLQKEILDVIKFIRTLSKNQIGKEATPCFCYIKKGRFPASVILTDKIFLKIGSCLLRIILLTDIYINRYKH